MKFIARNIFVVLLALSSGGSVAAEMTHPVFGYSYSINDATYKSVNKCIVNAINLKSSHYWIFSEYFDVKSSVSYVVVAGLIPTYSDNLNDDISFEPDFGALIKITAGACEVLGTPDVLWEDGALENDLKEGLIESAIQMAIVSEGKNNFVEHFSGNMYESQLPEIKLKINKLRER
jgi:hypothetical protein